MEEKKKGRKSNKQNINDVGEQLVDFGENA